MTEALETGKQRLTTLAACLRDLYNAQDQWLVDPSGHSHLPEQDLVNITKADFQKRVSGMKTWTASDADMIHSYWLKKLAVLHEHQAAQMSQLLEDGTYPVWLMQDRMVLIMKDPQRGIIPTIYWPMQFLFFLPCKEAAQQI